MLTPRTILVTGATGNIGYALLQNLKKQNVPCIAGVSSDESAKRLPAGVLWRIYNYQQPASLLKAMQGMTHLFLIVPFNRDMLQWGEFAVKAAEVAGIKFIVRLSGLKASPECPAKMGQLHGEIDQMVQNKNIPCSILRCNSFMQNFTGHYAPMIRKRKKIILSHGDAKVAFIDTIDIARAAANILLNIEQHRGTIYDLNGSELLSYYEIAAIITSITGQEVCYQAIEKEAARESYTRMGLSSWSLEVMESLDTFIRNGAASELNDSLEQLINREPRTFLSFARQHKHSWCE